MANGSGNPARGGIFVDANDWCTINYAPVAIDRGPIVFGLSLYLDLFGTDSVTKLNIDHKPEVLSLIVFQLHMCMHHDVTGSNVKVTMTQGSQKNESVK